jgi:hypothetical protein
MRFTPYGVAFALALLTAGCASSPRDDNELRSVEPKPKKNPNVITRDELLDPAITSRDALTAIRHLRPNFFSYRGPTSTSDPTAGNTQISQDYGPLRPISDLLSMNTFTFVEVRYLTAEESAGRFGLRANGGPVIVLVSNKDAH